MREKRKKNTIYLFLTVVICIVAAVAYVKITNSSDSDNSLIALNDNENKKNSSNHVKTRNVSENRDYEALIGKYKQSKNIGTLRTIALTYGDVYPEEIFSYIMAETTGNDKTSMLVDLFQKLAMSNNFETAFKLMSQLGPGNHRTQPLARFWANISSCNLDHLQAQLDQLSFPEDKVAFVNSMLENKRLDDNMKVAFVEANKEDPSLAERFSISQAERIFKDKGLVSGINSLLQNGSLDTKLASRIVNHSINNDPESTISELSKLQKILPQHLISQAVVTSVSIVAQKNPEHASTIVLSMEDDKIKSAGMFALLGQWFNQDSIRASKWINNIQTDSDKDLAIKYLIPLLINKKESSAAIEWANQVKSPELKRALIEKIEASP